MTELPNCYRCKTEPCTCADGVTLLQGDCKTVMELLPEKHFQMCVTSPPYFALRSYLSADHPDKALEIGSETSIEAFVATMVEVFRSVWRVLRDDGVCFVNLGDGYTSQGNSVRKSGRVGEHLNERHRKPRLKTLGPKNLIGIPWRVALALQADGWYLRDALIWQKPAPMPGSQRDRCTASYEYIFQLTKRPRYFWDMEAVREPSKTAPQGSISKPNYDDCKWEDCTDGSDGCRPPMTMNNREYDPAGRIPRNAQQFEWDESDVRALMAYMNAMPACPNMLTMASEGFPGAHFATFPRALPEWCIKAATSEKECCPECGAPWVRITDSERVRTRPGKNTKVNVPYGWARGDETHDSMSLNTPEEKGQRRPAEEIGNRDPGRHVTSTWTIGWRPDCECYGMPIISDPPTRPNKKKKETKVEFAARLRTFAEAHKAWTVEWKRVSPLYLPLATAPCQILDPFGGVGTTGLAAIALQRRCTLIELSEDYCDQIVKRLRNGLYTTSSKRDNLPGQRSLFDDTEKGR